MKIDDNMKQAVRQVFAVIGAFRKAVAEAVGKAIKRAVSEGLARQKRIARVIALIPQHLRGNPMCRDPWHRGSRA